MIFQGKIKLEAGKLAARQLSARLKALQTPHEQAQMESSANVLKLMPRLQERRKTSHVMKNDQIAQAEKVQITLSRFLSLVLRPLSRDHFDS